ncbi:MAG: NADP-dependent isocitrate dehydrogenase, partial [Desulfobacteraceae bacterium]|nr:NADP-dependent isocitrate dehydrogenase [Desulfobacteraceae bacterium]
MTKIISIDKDTGLKVPDCVEIPFIEGDGIGPDIWKAAQPVFDTAVEKAFNGKKQIEWLEIPAGEKGFNQTGEFLSDASLKTIEEHRVAIKGPLATPVGRGMRSLNVRIRQELDLYACIRPVRYFSPVQSPVKHPEKVDITVFRENTEDLYAGIEWSSESEEVEKLTAF